MALAPLVAHWGLIGGALLVGAPLSSAAGITTFVTIALAAGCPLLLLSQYRNPAVQERMGGGASTMLRSWYLVVLAAAASNVAGTVLLAWGEPAAGGWAMGLGTFVMLCEVAALIGASLLTRRSREQRHP